jgi:hypothetical protein
MINDIKNKFVKLDDDYIKLSNHLFDLNADCEKEMIKLNEDMEVVQNSLNN